MIGVRVRIDDCHDGPLTELLVDELERGRGRFLGGKRVKYNPAGLALDEADVSQVITPYLVNFFGQYLVETVVHIEDGLALQRRMDAVEIVAMQQPFIAAHVPGDMAGLGHDLLVFGCRDETALLFFEVTLVLEWQDCANLFSSIDCGFGGRIPLRIEMSGGIRCYDLAPACGECRRADPENQCQGDYHPTRTDNHIIPPLPSILNQPTVEPRARKKCFT